MTEYVTFEKADTATLWRGGVTSKQKPIAQAKKIGRYWTIDLYQVKVNGQVLDPDDLKPLHNSALKAFADYLNCLNK